MNYDFNERPYRVKKETIDLSELDTDVPKHRHLPFAIELIVCAALVLSVLCIKYFDAESFSRLQIGYKQVMSNQLELFGADKTAENKAEEPEQTAVRDRDREGSGESSGDDKPETADNAAEPYGRTAKLLGFNCFRMPVEKAVLTCDFGLQASDQSVYFHRGLDLAVPNGTPVAPAMKGTVIATGESDSYGNYIKIQHTENISTFYAHCSSIQANEGDSVDVDDVIAFTGSTGNATGPHLHFEVRFDDYAIDPNGFFASEVMRSVQDEPKK